MLGVKLVRRVSHPGLIDNKHDNKLAKDTPPDLGFEPKAYSLEGCRSSN
ncbi:hypothetical protein PROFUN_03762 [Planoprotostelium fungivorum]|uniref:Uncharacterized protein n=1 Tax=Planoprotostelium fungivorum TaxID=1890364 RepID=A0A2P6NDS7_9EUKA|nr:hypothetical protein PROFUN_03762 [Planoprotostelium fungivorum]